MTRRQRREMLEAWLFLSPWVIGFVLFTAGPVIASLVLSFFDYDVITAPKFAGLRNYALMAQDRLLVKSLLNTIAYAAMYIPLAIVVALSLAMLLNQNLRGMRIFRTIFYLPTLTQGVATFTLWAVVFDAQTGPINRALRTVGVADPPRWLNDPAWTKPALVIMAVWSVGGMMIIFLAGLQNIPAQLYEAAEIDGATGARRFLHVTLPMLSPTVFFNVIISTIAAFQVFAAAVILTGVGPQHSTLFYVYHLYKKAFEEFRMGYASAMAWLLFAIVLVLTLLQMHFGRKWVHYE
jgi:multiple sugar transport system permease protein